MTSATSEDISSIFHITEHETPCFHIREDIVRTSVEDGVNWKMSVKQYTPIDNLEPREGDITILGAPCLGFPMVSDVLATHGQRSTCNIDRHRNCMNLYGLSSTQFYKAEG